MARITADAVRKTEALSLQRDMFDPHPEIPMVSDGNDT